MVANDTRTVNRLVIYRPPGNIINQSELVSMWESKTGTSFKRVYLSESEMISLSQSNILIAFIIRVFSFYILPILIIADITRYLISALPHPDHIPVCVLHYIFVKGDQTNFELGEGVLEASTLYPDYKYTPIDVFLDASISAPREIKLTSFA